MFGNQSEPKQFVEVWVTSEEYGVDRGRGCTTGVCDLNDGQPVAEVGLPPAHPFCQCSTAMRIQTLAVSDGIRLEE